MTIRQFLAILSQGTQSTRRCALHAMLFFLVKDLKLWTCWTVTSDLSFLATLRLEFSSSLKVYY